MRKLTTIALGSILALTLAACGGDGAGSEAPAPGGGEAPTNGGGDAPAPEDVTIGVAMPTETSERWIADGNAVEEGLAALGYNVDKQFAGDDIPVQTQQIDQMINSGVDVLIIASIDGTALTSQLEAAGAEGIPVIAYDRLINQSENVDFYVTFDNYQVGVAQATGLLHGLGLTDRDGNPADDAPEGPLNIELFAGSPDDNNANFFWQGAIDTLQPFLDDGSLEVASGQTNFDQAAILRWSQETAQRRMEDLLTSTYAGGTELHGVLSPFDGISRGIITALQSVGMGPTISEGLPIVTGQDAEIASVALINQDVQSSTIFKDTRTLAVQAVEATQSFVEGGEPEANDTETYDNGVKIVPSYLLDVETVYADNIQELLIDSGYWTEEQVERGVA